MGSKINLHIRGHNYQHFSTLETRSKISIKKDGEETVGRQWSLGPSLKSKRIVLGTNLIINYPDLLFLHPMSPLTFSAFSHNGNLCYIMQLIHISWEIFFFLSSMSSGTEKSSKVSGIICEVFIRTWRVECK